MLEGGIMKNIKKENKRKMFVQCKITEPRLAKLESVPVGFKKEPNYPDINLGDKLESYLETAVSSLHGMTKQVNMEKLENKHHLLSAAVIMLHSIFEQALCQVRPELADRDYGPRFMQTLRDLDLVSPDFEDFMGRFVEDTNRYDNPANNN